MSRQALFAIDNDGAIHEKKKCTACSLWAGDWLHTNCMDGLGKPGATLFFVGQAPGKEDDNNGQPMTGYNGRLFRDYLNKARIRTEEVYITNALKCCLFEKEPTTTMFNACKDHLQRELEHIKPKAIVVVGAKALLWLTGFSGVSKARRRSLPCVLDPKIPVYSIPIPLHLAT